MNLGRTDLVAQTARASATTGAPKGRILVVDDDRIILDSLGEFLRLEGYEVDGVTSTQGALAALERRTYNIAIADVNMPESDGFELLR
ncbi:MAG: response regulator, partial [Planctomycetota bacterium]